MTSAIEHAKQVSLLCAAGIEPILEHAKGGGVAARDQHPPILPFLISDFNPDALYPHV